MILGNPSSRRDSFFILSFLLSFLFILPHTVAQGIYGYITESLTHHPVEDAEVSLLRNDSIIAQITTDSNGYYFIRSAEAGRFVVYVAAEGYATIREEEVLLDGYTVHRLEYALQRESIVLNTVSVVSSKRRFEPATILIRPDDLVLVAGNFEDPVRVAHSQPGVVLLNDQSNQLSLRGQTPLLNTWQVEGLEIVNPSHTSNAGTLSDRPTQSGGGINMFSAQILGTTTIHTGLNPMSTGRIAGAVINMNLHETAVGEWRAKAGLIGLEAGGGTALSENSILDFNLRYSFTGLLADFGVDFGGEKIGFYDGVVSYLHRGEKHKFKWFAFAGNSQNDFEHPETPERHKDFFDIRYDNTIYGTGLRYDVRLNERTDIKTGLAYSTTDSEYRKAGTFESDAILENESGKTEIISAFASLNYQLTQQIRSTVGLDLVNRTFENAAFHLPLWEENRIRPYVNFMLRLSKRITLDVGGDLMRETQNDEDWVPGGKLMLNWDATHKLHFYAGARRAPTQSVIPWSQSENQIKATAIEAGGILYASRNTISLTGFAQQLNDIPAFAFIQFGATSHMADYLEPTFPEGPFGLNYLRGEAKQIGAEAEWIYSGPYGWSWSVNQTVYSAQRGFADEDLESGRFDGKWSTHFMIAKEWVRSKSDKQRTWNISARGIFNGGLREEVIDEETSQLANTTIFLNQGDFAVKLPGFKRIDLSISRTTAYPKTRWRWMLDIQNAFGLTNIAYHYFDPFLNRIEAQEHLGIIPVLSLQVSW